ncbi:MAG: hypothetical protein QGH59_06050, partial [Gemmatimonadota bacterium]|nr:hypothetical protein [Gemmatimonadota bacterium]
DAARDILSGISEGGGPESAGLGGGSGLPPGRSLVASWRGKDGGAVALFLPGSADEVAAIARKIPHYSKYSYLVFAGTKNEAKGVWSAGVSPLTVSLAGE